MMNSMKYEFTPLTPIHIGSGEELQPYEYIIKNNYLYKINLTHIMKQLPERERQLITQYMLKDIIQLRKLVYQIYKENYGYINKIEVTPEIEQLYTKKLGGTPRFDEQNQLLIQAFIQSMGKEYIPGSTLKGAIRGCFLHAISKEKEDINYTLIKTPKGIIKDVQPKIKGLDIEARYLERKSVQDDSFKTVKVSDTVGDLQVGVYESTIYTYKPKKGSFEKGIPMHMVCAKGLLQDQQVKSVQGRLTVQEAYFEKLGAKGLPISLEQLVADSHMKAQDMLIAEKEFYKRAGYTYTTDIYKIIQSYYDKLDKECQMLIRIGRGAGMNSTTFNLVNQGRMDKTDPRSRMLVEHIYPMGWGVMTLVE